MTAQSIPQGWRLEESEQEIHPGRIVRDYPCGCEAGINPPHGEDQRFRVAVWDEKPDGYIHSILLTGDDDDGYPTMEEAIAACDKAVADHKPVEKLGISEAYTRIDEGEDQLHADVLIDREALEETLLDQYFERHRGEPIEFSYRTDGTIIAKLRQAEEGE